MYQSLVNDSEFFEGNDIIDYSLLVGIHTCDIAPPLQDASIDHSNI